MSRRWRLLPVVKQILVLSRRDERPDFDTSLLISDNLNSLGGQTTYEHSFLENLVFIFDGQHLKIIDFISGKDIKDYDGVFLVAWFKTKIHQEIALSVALYIKSHKGKILNSEALLNRSASKLSQQVIAAINGVSTMPFIVTMNPEALYHYLETSSIGYPMIVKALIAWRGKDNYLVKNIDELKTAMESLGDNTPIVQTYIENDGDYRLIIMGEEVKLVIRRQGKPGSHLNNTSQGGMASIVDIDSLDNDMINDSKKIGKLLNREITGVDMIIKSGSTDYYFLEANNMPQISTGSFVDLKTKALGDFLTEWVES